MAQVSVHERIVSQPVGCERTDHGSEAGWGLACVFSRRIRKWFVSGWWMGTHGPSRRGGTGACICVSRRIRNWFCLDLLDGNAKAIKAGWTCKCIPRRIRKWFVWTCWMGTQRRSRRDGLANVFRDASESGLSRPAGWERMGDQGGMGACICLETHQKLVSAGCEGTSNHSN